MKVWELTYQRGDETQKINLIITGSGPEAPSGSIMLLMPEGFQVWRYGDKWLVDDEMTRIIHPVSSVREVGMVNRVEVAR